MKNFVVATFLTAALSMAFVSCDNGAYDADPQTNNGGLNPLNPNSGVDLFLGHMKADVNGTTTAYYPSYYKDVAENTMLIVGKRGQDNVDKHRFVSWVVGYDANPSQYSGTFYYLIKDPTSDSSIVYGGVAIKGSVFSIVSKEHGNLKGTIGGEYTRIGSIAGDPDVIINVAEHGTESEGQIVIVPYKGKKEVFTVTNGEFYVPKK